MLKSKLEEDKIKIKKSKKQSTEEKSDLKKTMDLPTKDGDYVESGKKCYFVADGEVKSGTVLQHNISEASAEIDKDSDYNFSMTFYSVETSSGTIETSIIFSSDKNAEAYLKRLQDGFATVYRINRIGPDPL